MLRRYWRLFWGEPEPNPVIAVLEKLGENQAQQMALLQGQLALFEKWMAMFTTPQAPLAPEPDMIEQEMRDSIALSARMGHTDALDLLKDEQAMENYIRLVRQSQ